MTRNLVVVAQVDDGQGITDATIEVLDEAAALCKTLKGRLRVIICAAAQLSDLSELHKHGANLVTIVRHPVLGQFDAAVWCEAIAAQIDDTDACLVLLAETAEGRSLAPRLAARLDAIHCSRVARITAESDGSLVIDRVVGDGALHAGIPVGTAAMAVAGFQPGSLGVGRPVRGNTAVVEEVEYEPDGSLELLQVLGVVPPDPQTVPISEARFVIAGGQGFKDESDFAQLAELGRALGMTVGGSKPIVDQGWLTRDRLIGASSGRRLAPEVFLGFGISGASHFVAGMKDSRAIIAVNTNGGVPLMKMADLAVEADLYEVIPTLLDRAAGRQASS